MQRLKKQRLKRRNNNYKLTFIHVKLFLRELFFMDEKAYKHWLHNLELVSIDEEDKFKICYKAVTKLYQHNKELKSQLDYIDKLILNLTENTKDLYFKSSILPYLYSRGYITEKEFNQMLNGVKFYGSVNKSN